MRGYAVVDVETSGLSPADDRVLSLAVLVTDVDGRKQDEFATLLNPGCDPGPVWVHGLTARRLRGAPQFPDIVARLHAMLDGRVFVAHNAQFDYGFLFHESQRAGAHLPTTHRLCTIALSRRLNLPVPNQRLESVAAYWGVRQHAAHDALEDARVVTEIFARSLDTARQYDIPIPVLSCFGRGEAGLATAVPRVPCTFHNPSTWAWGSPLVQGMKIAITGPTVKPRAELATALTSAGLDVMNNVSGRTRLVVVNDPQWTGTKIRKARELGIPTCHEEALLRLLSDVRPGEPKAAPTRKVSTPKGPWHGTRLLVLGGNHDEAAAVRARVTEYGARVLLTLGATTTHVVMLPGGEHDPRMPKIRDRQLITLIPDQVTPGGVVALPATDDAKADAEVLVRGQVVDLPADCDRLSVSAAWTPRDDCEVDLVAFAVGDDHQVGNDSDFVFYNAPVSPDGGIALTVDGDAEQGVVLNLDDLPSACTRVIVAAAIDGSTFGELGPVSLTFGIDSEEFAGATLDAATNEASLVLTEIYKRGDGWRLRVVGRGYDGGLRDLVERHGVQVDDQ